MYKVKVTEPFRDNRDGVNQPSSVILRRLEDLWVGHIGFGKSNY